MNERSPKAHPDDMSDQILNPDQEAARTDEYWKSGKLAELEEYYQKALAVKPSYEMYLKLGKTQMALGKGGEALDCFKNAHIMKPEDYRAFLSLGNAFSQSVDPQIASLSIAYYKKALEFSPGNARIYNTLGAALNLLGEQEEGIDCIKQALKIDPDFVGAQFNLCVAQIPILYHKEEDIRASSRRYRQALEHLVHTIKLDTPRHIEEAAKAVGPYQPFYLVYQGHNDRDLQRLYGELICRIQAAKYPQWAVSPPLLPINPQHPLRIGIVAGFFYGHSNWKILIKGWVENLNKTRYQLYGYYTDAIKDAQTEAARRNFVRFVENIYSVEGLAQVIRDDQLHVLIYPEVGMNSMIPRLAALRLAPIQCVSWGHPTTSGLPTVDYFLGSDLMEPAGAQARYTERLVRLPRLSTCYTPPGIHRHRFDPGQLRT
jgi:protein O-GlcNAc transferase